LLFAAFLEFPARGFFPADPGEEGDEEKTDQSGGKPCNYGYMPAPKGTHHILRGGHGDHHRNEHGLPEPYAVNNRGIFFQKRFAVCGGHKQEKHCKANSAYVRFEACDQAEHIPGEISQKIAKSYDCHTVNDHERLPDDDVAETV